MEPAKQVHDLNFELLVFTTICLFARHKRRNKAQCITNRASQIRVIRVSVAKICSINSHWIFHHDSKLIAEDAVEVVTSVEGVLVALLGRGGD
jgi:hypothetical protein